MKAQQELLRQAQLEREQVNNVNDNDNDGFESFSDMRTSEIQLKKLLEVTQIPLVSG